MIRRRRVVLVITTIGIISFYLLFNVLQKDVSNKTNIQKMRKNDLQMLQSVDQDISILLSKNTTSVANVSSDGHKVVSSETKLYQTQQPEVESVTGPKDPKVQLIIFSRWRYGSSFTGDLFNNNPDITYFYEPLRHKMYKDAEKRVQIHQDQIDMLHDILKCEFTGKDYTWWNVKDTLLNCGASHKFGASILCQKRPKNKKKSRPQQRGKYDKRRPRLKRADPNGFRRSPNEGAEYWSADLSDTTRSRVTEEICRSGKHVAVKTVRVPDLKHFHSIVTDRSMNVKVIQLVRDPRGVYLSRKQMPSVFDMELNECDEMKHNLNYWRDPPSWLKDRYMLLRYEDLADDPLNMIQTIYNFLGLPVPDTVKTFLEVNEMKRASSGKTAYSWRDMMNYQVMNKVQDYCMDTLLMAGYVPMKSEKELRNLEIPSIRKFPYPLQPNMTSQRKTKIRSRRGGLARGKV